MSKDCERCQVMEKDLELQRDETAFHEQQSAKYRGLYLGLQNIHLNTEGLDTVVNDDEEPEDVEE